MLTTNFKEIAPYKYTSGCNVGFRGTYGKGWVSTYKNKKNVGNIYVYREICTILQISNFNTKKKLRTHHFIETKILQKYLCGLLSIVIDEADLQNITNQLINDISNFNNEHFV